MIRVLCEILTLQKISYCYGGRKNGSFQADDGSSGCVYKNLMVGFTESLNVSVAAAVIMEELTHRQKKSN